MSLHKKSRPPNTVPITSANDNTHAITLLFTFPFISHTSSLSILPKASYPHLVLQTELSHRLPQSIYAFHRILRFLSHAFTLQISFDVSSLNCLISSVSSHSSAICAMFFPFSSFFCICLHSFPSLLCHRAFPCSSLA